LNQPPADLKGFHVEMAGSPSGPWKRLTKNPVAWWERQYTAQGLETIYEDFSSQPHRSECTSFRVLSVDEDGNESAVEPAVRVPATSATCPTTPPAPQNLRATSLGIETFPNTDDDAVRLEWDSVGMGVRYYVYRLINFHHYYFFYQTMVTSTTSFIEDGSDFEPVVDNNPPHPNEFCPNKPYPCGLKNLEAYYVTAQYTTGGGESPRSNLLLWKWNTPQGPGYVRLDTDESESMDGIAKRLSNSDDGIACWETPEILASHDSLQQMAFEIEMPFEAVASAPSAVAWAAPALSSVPMRTLGTTLADPPWVLFDLHTDHLGTVRVITDNAGTVVSTHDYYPFGESMKGFASFNTHQFTGHERDAESGMDYMMARYYTSSVSRFMSVDPALRPSGDPQKWNRYTYVLNNPLAYSDPNGRYEQNVHAGWTYFLARQAGFSESRARAIAKADNDVDSGQTEPYGSAAMRATFHAFGTVPGAGKDRAIAAQSPGSLGQRLHFFQDSYSHEGLGSVLGQALTGSAPDKTRSDPTKAVRMAMGTFDILSQKAAEHGMQSFGAPSEDLLHAMAESDADVLDYNPNTKSLTLEIDDPEKARQFAEKAKAMGIKVTVKTK
jgi:RHS repeat-associated protein